MLQKQLLVCLLPILSMATQGIVRASSTPKAVPEMQVIPMPYDRASFQRDGLELARYHFGSELPRPFLYPIIGPSGRSLTRMGHPHDPESHSHHNSVWISHHDTNGVNFWGDRGDGKIRHKRIVEYIDTDAHASLIAENEWIKEDDTALLLETRRIRVIPLPDAEWLLIMDMTFKAANGSVILGKTPFGMIGVRMAKTIGVHDGGGTIRNSEGAVNEKEVLWKQAKWVDYSGAITNDTMEGIALFDHPKNPNFPSTFHVRNDGWMGASLTFSGPREIRPNESLHLCYGLYIHSGLKSQRKFRRSGKLLRKFRPMKKSEIILDFSQFSHLFIPIMAANVGPKNPRWQAAK